MKSVYVSRNPSLFLKMAAQEELVDLHVGPLPEHGVCFERRDTDCACPNRLIVNGRCIVCPSSTIMAFPHYGIPDGCTPEEEITIVTWLTRQRFLSFGSDWKNKTFSRYLDNNGVFEKHTSEKCPNCEKYVMDKDPVFFLKSIVLSALNKGPTLESALDG